MTSTFIMIAAVAIAMPIWAGNVSAEPRRGGNLLPPVSPACISSPFGPRVLPNQPQAGSYHYGIDLPAPLGAPVLATAPGTVIRVQNTGPGGLEMLVQHDGFVGIYSHFGMVTPAFAEGKRTIAAGEQLGAVGNTGVTSGPHLYFEMDLAGKPVDPAPYIGVPDCNSGLRRTLSRMLDADGKTRQYYQYQPATQFYQSARQYWQSGIPVGATGWLNRLTKCTGPTIGGARDILWTYPYRHPHESGDPGRPHLSCH